MAAFVPKRAANVNGAHLFLDFIMDPQRGAQCFEYLGYYCTFKASENFISSEKKEYLILPDFKNFEMIQNLPQDAEEAHDRIWQSFITRSQGSGR
jgi:spermidine/putrescine-binding protein